MTLIWLVLGGAAGTVARYYLAERVTDATGSFAAGILVVNVLGSLAIGLFLGFAEVRFDWPEELRILVATGFLGGFTTFSALAWQTYRFADAGDAGAAIANVALSLALGMAAVWAGASAAKLA